MIYLSNVSLKYGDRELLKDVSFKLTKKDRAGLIGKNGAGKSTLFKIITQHISADAGEIQSPNDFSIGFLKQDLHFTGNRNVIDETKTCFAEVIEMEVKLAEVTAEVAERTDYTSDSYNDLIQQMSDLTNRIELLGGSSLESDCEKILKGLGFQQEEFTKKVSEFSGGWQMRIELAKLLLTQPDLLLLDEPTNHLDIESIIWLESYLNSYPGIVLVISHDKQFLDNVCNRIIELELGRVNLYAGNYSKYEIEKVARKELTANAYVNQQKVIAQKERTITRFMAKANKTSLAQSMQKQLDKMERVELIEEDNSAFKISFGTASRAGRIVVDLKDVTKYYGDVHVLEGINLNIERGDRIAFVGQNGQGKTTLAKMIVGQLASTRGEIKFGTNVMLSYYAQNQAELIDDKKTVLQVMEDISPAEKRTSIRSILGAFLFSGEDAEKKVSVLSGGERARLAMAAMILQPTNLIIMDEPTNHLDITSKEVLKGALQDYDGTLIIVSHDREFLGGLSDKVYEFTNKNVKEYLGDINYFLEKKKVQDLREFETSKAKEEKTKEPEVKVDYHEQKNLKRKLQYVERDIAKIEEAQKKREKQLMDPDFYKMPEFAKVNGEYKSDQERLDNLMLEWELLADQIV